MAKLKVVMTGSEELNRKLAALTNQQAREAIRKAARPALQPCLSAARSYAPKRTGKLKKNIKIRAISRSRKRIGARVALFRGQTFYSTFQEWGWRVGRKIKNEDIGLKKGAKRSKIHAAVINSKNNSRKKIKGRGFLKKAGQQTAMVCMDLYAQGIKQYISSVMRKG